VLRLRAVDVARGAGVSVQQVRNYEAAGVLPPIGRTESGYRIFTPHHAAAVSLVRLLADGHGWDRARTVMRAVHARDVATALTVLDRSHAELDRERSEIAGVLSAFAAIATPPMPAFPPGTPSTKGVRIGAVADAVGVRTSALRVWERHGLLRPSRERVTGYRVYDDAEVRRARVVSLLRRGNYPIAIVRAVIDELRSTGSPERVRTELARREQDLNRRSLLRLRASAALYEYLSRVE
jgi:DNA-binding transcriptional MerR regulator